jgi:hypothetical protein
MLLHRQTLISQSFFFVAFFKELSLPKSTSFRAFQLVLIIYIYIYIYTRKQKKMNRKKPKTSSRISFCASKSATPIIICPYSITMQPVQVFPIYPFHFVHTGYLPLSLNFQANEQRKVTQPNH